MGRLCIGEGDVVEELVDVNFSGAVFFVKSVDIKDDIIVLSCENKRYTFKVYSSRAWESLQKEREGILSRGE